MSYPSHLGSPPVFGGVHVLPFTPGFTSCFRWSPCLTLHTWIHPMFLVESMSYPSHLGSPPVFGGVHVLPFTPGFTPCFWWSPCLTLHTWVHPMFLVESMLLIFSFLCYVCIHLVYPMLPLSLDCPFLIAPCVFPKFYSDKQYSSALPL